MPGRDERGESSPNAAPRGAAYDERFARLEASGVDVHGEAALVSQLGPHTVLDAGCGTGRVAIELARRGLDVMGVDIDDVMLDEARRKAPGLPWAQGDLSTVELDRLFDLAVMAGNVMIFVEPDRQPEVVANVARHLRPGGLLLAGFTLDHRLTLARYDQMTEAARLSLIDRWATWDRAPFRETDTYAVSLHRAP